jgi:hypothetical protein
MEGGTIEDLGWLPLRAGGGRKEQKRGEAEQKGRVEAAIQSEMAKQGLMFMGWVTHEAYFNGSDAGRRLLIAVAPVSGKPLAPFVVGEE